MALGRTPVPCSGCTHKRTHLVLKKIAGNQLKLWVVESHRLFVFYNRAAMWKTTETEVIIAELLAECEHPERA